MLDPDPGSPNADPKHWLIFPLVLQPIPGIIMGGVLPFGCIFIQLFFVLNSIWSSQIYYM
jgi:hypothetical protein